MGYWPTVRPLCTQGSATQKNENTAMPQAGFEPMVPIFKQSKTIHALNHAAFGSGSLLLTILHTIGPYLFII
jgi:hypothetical protein